MWLGPQERQKCIWKAEGWRMQGGTLGGEQRGWTWADIFRWCRCAAITHTESRIEHWPHLPMLPCCSPVTINHRTLSLHLSPSLLHTNPHTHITFCLPFWMLPLRWSDTEASNHSTPPDHCMDFHHNDIPCSRSVHLFFFFFLLSNQNVNKRERERSYHSTVLPRMCFLLLSCFSPALINGDASICPSWDLQVSLGDT